MNTQTYRLVFNSARACMVAVAETARVCGKGGRAGGTRVRRRKQVWAKRCKQNRPVALVGWTYSAIHSGVFTQSTSNTSNELLQGAATLKAGYDAYKLVSGGAAEGIASQGTTKDGDPSGSAFGISVSVGINSSKQDNSSASTQSRGTSIQAKDIDITATSGNITAVGAKLQGENISLDAAKDINLLAAVNTNNIQSSNESHSLGGGVTFGIGQQNGISFQFNAGQANGNTNGVEVGYDNTLVTATNTLTVKSGGNTNLVGAQLAGDKVSMNVGGGLTIVTLQDTSQFDSEQHSSGISLSVCVFPFCVGTTVSGSINKSDSTIAHNYQSATGQSGIAAGSGGYDITVNGNTALVGGAITSTAPIDQNTLKTASITSSDLNNSQNTNSQSSSISLSYSGSSSAMGNLANNVSANLLGNLSAGAGLPANGSQSGVTQSVISPGNVTITGTGDATTDATSNSNVAMLTTRDASKANGALTNTLTLQEAQLIPGQIKEAQENAQAAQLVAPVINNLIGDLGAEKGWPPGSPQMVLLHSVAGVVQASISGTSLVSGATVGAVNEYVTPIVADYLNSNGVPTFLKDKNGKDVLDSNGKPVVNPEFADLLKAGSVILGATVGGAVGGSTTTAAAGGNVALSGTADNYLTHQQSVEKQKKLAAAKTEQEKKTIEQSYEQLDEQQKKEAAGCLLNNKCESIFSKTSLDSALSELILACSPPRLCTADENRSIVELKDFYADRDSIKTFTGGEELLLMNKGIGTAFMIARGIFARFSGEVASGELGLGGATETLNYGKPITGYGKTTTTFEGTSVVEGQVPNTTIQIAGTDANGGKLLLGSGNVGPAGANGGAGAGAFNSSAPWLDEVANLKPGGTFLQCGNGSCVSATAQNITGGAVTEAQMVRNIGEWSNAESLASALNQSGINGGKWIGGMVSNTNTLALANKGIIGAELQVPGQAAHMVAIQPIPGAPGTFQVMDTGVGATYTVNSAWILKYVSKVVAQP